MQQLEHILLELKATGRINLDAAKQADFTEDLLALMDSRNRSGDRTLVLPSEYLEIVIERK